MNRIQKMLVFFAAFLAFAALVAFAFLPTQSVMATGADRQEQPDCSKCHQEAAGLWEESHHKTGNVNCFVCHKLAAGSGEHPWEAKYTVESEATTCLVCHTEVAGENIAGQLALSQHGEVGLKCISCHEQHSQGLKLSDGSRTVCENCHKQDTADMLGSTHYAAGLACVNCHMGDDKNHSLVVAVHTCDECHTDLHQARRMLDAGLAVKAMAEPAAMAEVVEEPVVEEETVLHENGGGVQMPQWTLVFSGMLIGGVLAWALVGKDPGQPSDKVRKGKS